jgi:D-alanyl-D-alanine carboxypeptidase (penicillin-binding protein 5/6)
LLQNFAGADGLKTGFIPESGHNIALTAERNQTRFILVLLGAPSETGGARIREADGIRLLGWAFDNFKTVSPQVIQIDNARLWKGREDAAQLTIDNADFTAPLSRANALFYNTVIPYPLIAPLPQGSFAGYLVVSDEYGELNRVPLVTATAYERGNIFKRIWHSVLLLFAR